MRKARPHKSTKVPGVKLRPAPAAASAFPSAPLHEAVWVQDSQFDDSAYNKCPRPFKGLVLCATAISQKHLLFQHALELGATCLSAFTDKVTHLIASVPQGDKYRVAVQRKIPVLKPEWVEECYAIWLKGDDVDVEASKAKWAMEPFEDCVVAITGISDPSRRSKINKLVTKHGGTFVKVIERPVKVTHLIVGSDYPGEGEPGDGTETEKVRYAKKFNARGESDIKIVWEDWFWDCVDYKGRFEEERYLKDANPVPAQRQDAVDGQTDTDVLPPASSAPSSAPTASSPPLAASSQPRPLNSRHVPPPEPPAPLSRHGSGTPFDAPPSGVGEGDAEEEEAVVTKKRVPAETLIMWESLLRPRGYGIEGGKLVKSPSHARVGSPSELQDSPLKDKGKGKRKAAMDMAEDDDDGPQSIIRKMRRNDSFVPAGPSDGASVAKRIFARISTKEKGVLGDEGRVLVPPSRENSLAAPNAPKIPTPHNTPPPLKRFLEGKKFEVVGEAFTSAVRSAILDHGGTIHQEGDDEEPVDFVLVRLATGSPLFSQEEDFGRRDKYRTECWLERCIFEERIVAPGERAAWLPLAIGLPVPGASEVIVSTTGVREHDLAWLRRLLRCLDITLATTFTRQNTHLVIGDDHPNERKIKKAGEWDVKIVDMEWVDEVARTGLIPSDKTKGRGSQEEPDDVGSKEEDVRQDGEERCEPMDVDHDARPEQDPVDNPFGPAHLLCSEDLMDDAQIPVPTQPSPTPRSGVPSSRTPSPLKLPPRADDNSYALRRTRASGSPPFVRASLSPVVHARSRGGTPNGVASRHGTAEPPDQDEAESGLVHVPLALHKSLSSLLSKRASSNSLQDSDGEAHARSPEAELHEEMAVEPDAKAEVHTEVAPNVTDSGKGKGVGRGKAGKRRRVVPKRSNTSVSAEGDPAETKGDPEDTSSVGDGHGDDRELTTNTYLPPAFSYSYSYPIGEGQNGSLVISDDENFALGGGKGGKGTVVYVDDGGEERGRLGKLMSEGSVSPQAHRLANAGKEEPMQAAETEASGSRMVDENKDKVDRKKLVRRSGRRVAGF